MSDGSEVAGAVAEARSTTMLDARRSASRSVDVIFRQMVGVLIEGAAHLPAAVGVGARVEAPVPTGVALAEALDRLLPGQELVGLLDGLEPADLHEAAVVEAIAGWERITSWVAARQARMITELARRRELGRLGEFVADEVAARLATTRAVAERKVSLATCLDAMPELADALHAGAVDVRKAVALIDTTDHLPLDTARELVAAALPDATELTVPQLRARIRRLDLTRDPAAADHRHTHARAQRHVTLTPAPDSMAWLSAYLPADDALRVFTALDALAGSSATDDSTGVDARRADALSDTFTRILDSGLAPSGESLPTRRRVRPHLQVTAAATTLLGLDEAPAELAGYGPIPAAMARSIAADATWRRIFTDPATGSLTGIGPRSYRPGADLTATVLARDTTCTFPGCRTPSYRCDVDHVEPFDPTRPGDAQTTCANLHALCRHHHRLKTHTGWTVVRKEETGATHWTAPTGHRYRRPTIAADPSHPSVQPTAPPATGPPNPSTPPTRTGWDDPPPF